MLLLQITCDCGGSFDLVDKKTKGVQLHYIMQCRKCSGFRSFKTCEDGLVDAVVDGKEVKGLSRDNLRIVLLALIGGLTFTQHSYSTPTPLPEATWYRYQNILIPAIMEAGTQYFKEFRQLKKEKGEWRAQLNGAWSHRGFKARHHSYLVRDHDHNHVVSCIILKKDHVLQVTRRDGTVGEVKFSGNYFGTSKVFRYFFSMLCCSLFTS